MEGDWESLDGPSMADENSDDSTESSALSNAGTDVSGDEAGAAESASDTGDDANDGNSTIGEEMSLSDFISQAASTLSGGVVDLNALGDTVRRSLTQERKKIEEAERAEKRRKAHKKRKQARREEWLNNPHQMITRSKLPDLLRKTDLSYRERCVLNERYGKNRCRSCMQLKDLECFYRYLSPNPMRNKYHNLCIVCENKSYNERSEDVAITRMWSVCKRTAERRGHDFELTVEDIKAMFERQNGRCNYTGRPLVIKTTRDNTRRYEKRDTARAGKCAYHNLDKASIDRIDPSRGYVRDNVHMVCIHINYAKLDLSEEDFISLCRDVVHVAQTRGCAAPPPLTSSRTESVLPETAPDQARVDRVA